MLRLSCTASLTMSHLKDKFTHREQQILITAERLLLESSDYDLSLDELATELDMAKGTLYKHFSSKDELFLKMLIAQHANRLAITYIQDGAGAQLARFVLSILMHPRRTVMSVYLEERLSAESAELTPLFNELYQYRMQMTEYLQIAVQAYLDEQGSTMPAISFISSLLSMSIGGANLLSSSFYQRYVGVDGRGALICQLVYQVLSLPSLCITSTNIDTLPTDGSKPKELTKPEAPKLIKPLMPPVV